MELLLYLAEFQNEQGQVEDPLEVDRMMQSDTKAPGTELPAPPDRTPELQPESKPRRTDKPDHDAPTPTPSAENSRA
jgi:hypothetical protein